MYTLVLISLAICTLMILGSYLLKRIKERGRLKTWLASQPADAVISGRQRAADKGRALLEAKLSCSDFVEEFKRSEDPEIQKLVNIVKSIETGEFPSSYGKSIEKQILVLEKTTSQEERLNKWLNTLLDYGFRNISFPMAIINDKDRSVTIISTFEEYALDPDFYYWPFRSNATLIDSNGVQYSLEYQELLNFNYPKEKIAEVDLDTVKQLIKQRLRKKKLIPIIESSNTIKELYEGLYDKYLRNC
jgi:hypothetical protein